MAAKRVLRVGVDTVNGGTITGIISTKTFVGGQPIVCIGAAVQPHDPSTGDHNTATMATGSSKTFANGSPICGEGDLASCGHAASGGSNQTLYGT